VRDASENAIDDALIVWIIPRLWQLMEHKPENTNEPTSLPAGPDPIAEKLSAPAAITIEFEIVRRSTADLCGNCA
jgi:hypothetical protein